MKYLVLLLSLHWTEGFYSPIRDPDMLQMLFGDLSEVIDVRLPPPGQELPEPGEPVEEEAPDLKKLLFTPISDQEGTKTNVSHDIMDFNTITKALAETTLHHNASSLNESRRYYKHDVEDYYSKFRYYEGPKMDKMKNLALGFLIHTRFKCDFAIRQRRNSRQHKAYKIGYIFNRLRRIQYNQAKIINGALVHHGSMRTHVSGQYLVGENAHMQVFRMYEKLIRMDVDIRHLIELAIAVHIAPEPKAAADSSSTSDD